MINEELPGQTEPDLAPDLLGWCNCLFKDRGRTYTSHGHCIQALQRAQSEAQADQVWVLQEGDNYEAHHVSKEGTWPIKESLKAVAEFAPPWTYNEIWAFWAWWNITDNILKGSLALHNHCMSIFLEKDAARRMSGWHQWKMHRVPSRLLRKPALRLLCWFLPILTNSSSSNWC